jgi:methylenetetrahydrofolate dehydrogenase (NADP+)/methenyltetrahydrofolate cyclohydrolase
MSAAVIDGKAEAAALRARIAVHVATLPYQPGLAVVLVGDDPASAVYVRNKDRAAKESGLAVQTIRLPATTLEADLLAVIAGLNADPLVDGILVQLPLPASIRADFAIAALEPAKDVDGLTTINAGRLAQGRPIMALDGRPVALMLTAMDATVTIAHSRTQDLAVACRQADVLVAAVGRPEMVRGDWIAPGAVVIDVGINRLADGRLVGDVAYAEAAAVAGAITPVPGGVGPMTIACLIENTVAAAAARRG